MLLQNSKMAVDITSNGIIEKLVLKEDPHQMNWVINSNYLDQVGYTSKDKLFGNFELKFEDKEYRSITIEPTMTYDEATCRLRYSINAMDIVMEYDLSDSNKLIWKIRVENKTNQSFKLQHFSVWSSFAYIMFRDKHVEKNIFHSAALFPSISKDYTKLAVMRRSSQSSSLGLFQSSGSTLSVGSYCEFENKFFEAVSPSLDGVVYHDLILSSTMGLNDDWCYPANPVFLEKKESVEWEFVIMQVDNQEDFYQKAALLGHPQYDYTDLAFVGKTFDLEYQASSSVKSIQIFSAGHQLKNEPIQINATSCKMIFSEPGEHKIFLLFENGKEDQIIINVIDSVERIIADRVDYLCQNSYKEEYQNERDVFLPLSNQGESLGKMTLILKLNLLGKMNKSQIEKVERSLNHYVLNKWFEKADFNCPKNVYGDFYRVMDFEYLGHLLFLLSQIPDNYLHFHSSETYLNWASKVVELRINPAKHTRFREKEESEMLGVFFLYLDDLLEALKDKLPNQYKKISMLWENNIFNILEEKSLYKGAMTEHFYDNAGFGPAAASLANAHYHDECEVYADLLLANIGFSNDFRMQNPDRWWEALSYMIHSLWGGISAAAALDVFHELKKPEYLEASYRAFIAVLYCYDSNATSTTKLNPGEAASTFSCAKPHHNRPDLGHARFGQETFASDGGIFSGIFSESIKQTSDWDMGEELVAFLDRFGQDAYCYEKDGKLRLVNCHIDEVANQKIIFNDAPFPRHIFYLDQNDLRIIPNQSNVELFISSSDSCDS